MEGAEKREQSRDKERERERERGRERERDGRTKADLRAQKGEAMRLLARVCVVSPTQNSYTSFASHRAWCICWM